MEGGETRSGPDGVLERVLWQRERHRERSVFVRGGVVVTLIWVALP